VDHEHADFIPGITFRSVCACLLAMMVMGMHIQGVEVMLCDGSAAAEQALPISAMIVFAGLVIACGLLRLATRFDLLTRQELLCVLFAMLISAPMMTQGMWHRFVGLIASPPRTGSFEYLDAYSDKLWPHGPNLVEGKLAESNRATLIIRGNPPEWREIECNEGRRAVLPVLRNVRPEDVSSLALAIPADGARCGEPHLISCLVRPDGLVLSNASMVKADGSHGAARLVEIDASGLANRLGDVRVANMVMLGALVALKALAAEKDIVALLEKKLGTEPGKREILNLNKEALGVGAAEARKALARP
jgi:hypothetical protein